MLCDRIVEYKSEYSHYSRLQLLFEPVSTILLFKGERKGNLCGPVETAQYSEMLQVERFVNRNRMGVILSAPLQNGLTDHLASYKRGISLCPGIKRPLSFVDLPPNLAPILMKVCSYTSTILLDLHVLFLDELTLLLTLQETQFAIIAVCSNSCTLKYQLKLTFKTLKTVKNLVLMLTLHVSVHSFDHPQGAHMLYFALLLD